MGSATHVFVTGGTGLIGRALVERLLRRGLHVTLMLRSGSDERRKDELDDLARAAADTNGSLSGVTGDLCTPDLGLADAGLTALAKAGHCFHLAALYDIDADSDALEKSNVEGTKQLLSALRKARFDGTLHHVSSVAVAGDYSETFTEDMFEEDQGLPHPYHRSKLESETLVRASGLDYRIYRPSGVVGDSKTGAMDRIDGVYFSFAAIKKLAYALPGWARVPVPRIRGGFNLVPVDYVADAMAHIALHDSDARVFHLVDPRPPSLVKMTQMFLAAAGGPRLGPALDLAKLPGMKKTGAMLSMLPSVRELRDAFLSDLGLPSSGLRAMNTKVRFDDANTQAALAGSGIECPPLESYAKTLYRYYDDHLDPMKQRPVRYRRALTAKVVLVTGASRGIGLAVAQSAAEAGAKVLLVARDAAKLDAAVAGIRATGGEAYAHAADLSSFEEVDALAEAVLTQHGGVDVLIHNAARSIRRPVVASMDRFHDYERTMALNYFAPVRLTLRLLPSLIERSGTISHVLTMGVLIPGPYFAAYLATKSALDAFGDSLMSELQHEGIHVSSVYLPLVKTEMMAPVEEYAGRRDVMTPRRAAAMILDGVVDRRRRVMTPAGAYFAFSNRIAPATTSRVLNLIERAFPVGDAPSEFPIERAFITNAIGGSPI
ncbi:MAG: SDR family oxidoreductase [Deltaproteobacteria bacterium]|nr:MAG: SDR family oxidoreductase [Deltaproteobacteria bacterium]